MFSTIFPSIIIAFSFILGLIATLIIALSTDDLEVLSKMWKIVIGLFVYSYTPFFIIGLVTLITEWKKIQVKPFKKIFYLFTSPLFMFTCVPISIVVFFKKVEWKPIEHKASFTLQEIENSSIVQNNITSADQVIEQDDEEVKEINIKKTTHKRCFFNFFLIILFKYYIKFFFMYIFLFIFFFLITY